MAAPPGWVSPQWSALSRRPLLLGLPYGAAGFLCLPVVFLIVVLHLIMPGLILLGAMWIIGAALTRYDAYFCENLVAFFRMPRKLRAC